MTQFCCYSVWDGSHEKHRRIVLFLSVIDLILISALIVIVGISLYNAAFIDPTDPIHSQKSSINSAEGYLNSSIDDGTETEVANNTCENGDNCLRNSEAPSGKIVPRLPPYFEVVGYRIEKSIQLIIYVGQLFMTVFLVRALFRTDTHVMRTWLIVTEIITAVILLVLVIHLFGGFQLETVIVMGVYLIYQFIMIRTMARYIRRTEIELTQFGSIVEF